MPEFVEPEIEHLRNSSGDDTVSLLVGCSRDRSELGARIEDLGATSIENIGRNTLLVDIRKADAGELWELDGVRSLEPNDSDVCAQGNS